MGGAGTNGNYDAHYLEPREIMLLDLPRETLENILIFLDANDLGRLTRVCRHLHTAIRCGNSNNLWRAHCRQEWLVDRLESDCPNWFDQWIKTILNYGRYRECYAKVKLAWNMIEDFLSLHSPSTDTDDVTKNLLKLLRGGNSEEEIAAAESELGFSLPNDYRCSLRIHDGLNKQHTNSFLGTVQFYTYSSTLYLFPLKIVTKCDSHSLNEEFGANMWESNLHFLPIGGDKILESNILLAKDTCAFMTPGQVVQAAKLAWNKHRMPLGALGEFPNSHVIPNFSIGLIGKSKCFKDWLMDCARALPHYPIINKSSPIILRFYQHPDWVATTGHFTVRVGTALNPTLGFNSRTDPYLFDVLQKGGAYAYWVTIEMHEDAPKADTCMLESQHWVIRYASGKEEAVDGEGVIRETPSFFPGHVHQYASCTRFINEEWCTMEGHYNMRYLSSTRAAESLRIQIPKFHMPLPQVVWL